MYIFMLLLIFSSCEEERDLGNGYYRFAEYDVMDLGGDGTFLYKGDDINDIGNVIIRENVIKCRFDNNYIVAIQIPMKSIIRKSIKESLEIWCHFNRGDTGWIQLPNDSLSSIEMCLVLERDYKGNLDSMTENILKDNYYTELFKRDTNFWIISKKIDSLMGPFSFIEYKAALKTLGINHVKQFKFGN